MSVLNDSSMEHYVNILKLLNDELVRDGLEESASNHIFHYTFVYRAIGLKVPHEVLIKFLMDKGLTAQAIGKFITNSDAHREDLKSRKKSPTEKSSSKSDEKIPYVLLAKKFLREHYDFFINATNEELMYRKKGAEVYEVLHRGAIEYNSIYQDLINNGINLPYQQLQYILVSDFSRVVEPFKDYLLKLAIFDPSQPSELKRLIETVKSPDKAVLELFLKTWLLAMVKCNIEDEFVNQQMLVLVGKQGLGKNRWINMLLPKHLIRYKQSGTIDPEDKDTILQLSESILIEWDELANLTKKSVEAIKQFITASSVRVRKPYDKLTSTYKRRASFIGSTNEDRFLVDNTGNRRFLCIRIDQLDIIDLDHDRLYSELIALIKAGAQCYFGETENMLIDEHNKKFNALNLEEDLLLTYFSPCSKNDSDNPNILKCRAFELISKINDQSTVQLPIDNITIRRMGSFLKKHGFVSTILNGYDYFLVDPIIDPDTSTVKSNSSREF